MARLLTCGFETGDLTEFNGGYRDVTVQSAYKRTGTYALRFADQSGKTPAYIIHTFSADQNELFFRFALYKDESQITHSHSFLIFYDNLGGVQLTVYYNSATQAFDLYRGTQETGTLLATGSIVLRAAIWYMIEGRVLIDDATGAVTVKVNNTTGLAYAGDTKATAVAGIRSIMFQGANSVLSSYGYFYIDDVAVNDAVGSDQATYPGMGGVFLLKPTADGATVTWDTSTGTTHYTLVDDIPANTTDWIQALDTGEIDLFEVEDAPTYVNTINLVEVLYQAAVTESGYNLLTDVLRYGTVNYTDGTSTVVGLVPGYVLYKGSPYYKRPDDGTSVWGTAEVNALQAGVEIL